MSDHLPTNFGSYRHILLTAGPLILSQTGVMLMQLIDGLFLSWYSSDAIAAVVPAGLTYFAVAALFIGVTSYTSTFVAQYIGAQRPGRVGAVVWQGIYIAVAAGALIALTAPWSAHAFTHMGHAAGIAALESVFFRILCYGAVLTLLNSALSGFFVGRGDNVLLTAAQVIGLAVNAALDYALIFGRWGLPEMGMAGAAWATVIAQGVTTLLLLAVYLRPSHRRNFGTWRDWPFDLPLMKRLMNFGAPAGCRFLVEVTAWALFTLFVARVGADEAAATGIVMRLNGIAIFPIMGLSMAIAALVGQAQGAHRPDLAERCVWRGLAVGEGWMLLNVALFVLIPRTLILCFHDPQTVTDAQFQPVLEIGVRLMYFIATYCLVDASNAVLLAGLQGAGDTRWTLLMSALMHGAFLVGLIAIDLLHAGVYAIWTFATVLVIAYAITWLLRFRGGKWRTMRVIEHVPADLENKGNSAI
ncbi:MAG: MATE family efflux transporter [Planctomycetes bacterium]|nr:MATE family efflux transporter [Planctomycetota bacterium]